ncbi:efflux RND transporter permease subunit [Litorilinea aerophila]|uniref:Efflux RND transporter permease subunit n=1 Tax=Litorilinea aerophila TaxID=1204385 RepID=A0A540VGB9_9CHLR|nr:efflux RND transporter permease subunit [Litorilinea aerophila]MCC9076493.1 efflux RND transporter permease subunit [Litorilinea aerophila]
MKLWDIAIRQPVFMTMILAAGIVLGTVSYFRMPVDLFPNVEFPVVLVTTIYPGASPEEMEQQVTKVLEEELSAISGIDSVISRSSEGLSTLILQFDLDQSVDKASQEVREKVNLVRNRLPDGIQEPIIRRFNPSDNPILLFGVADRSGQYAPVELRKLVEDIIQAPLQRVPGVAAVDVDGGQVREIKVELDLEALEARRIAPQQVVEALRAENLNIPGGSVVTPQQELAVRTPGNFQTLDELRNLVIARRTAPVYLRDVARVVDGFEEREVITRLNGQESIVVRVRRQSGTNTTAVANAVKEELQTIAQANPNLEIVIAGDESLLVKQSTDGAFEDLIWSSILATLVILFFFRDLRNTVITMAGLPVIMVATLFFMDLAGISLNQVSLLALALVVGLVIDDAIVVRENIMRWVEKGYKPREAASKGTAEVVLPVLATSATILAVFLPVAYAEGIIGKFFRDFGLTVSIAIAVSTFESLTMAPMLSAYFFRASENVDREIDESRGNESGSGLLARIYGRSLNWALDHKLISSLVAVAVIAVSLYSARFIEQSFLPSLDRGQFDVSMEMPLGTSLAVTQAEAIKVEEILRSHPDVADVFTTIGGTSTPEQASFFVKVKDEDGRKVDTRKVINDLRSALANVPGISFQLADSATGGDVILGGKDVIVEMTAYSGDYGLLAQEARRVAQEMAQIPGIVDIDVSYKEGRPELQLEIDRQRASDLGLSTAQIGATVRTLVNGEVASVFRGEGPEADIRVQLSQADRASVEDILNIGLLSPTGQVIPLRNVARVQIASGPNEIVRVDRQPTISIGANISGRDEPKATADVVALLERMDFPTGIEAKLGGDAEAQADAFRNLGLALALAIIFIYMVLASQFGSFIQPLLIMLAMPLAVIGAILALSISGRPLDLTAFIGFIMLMGLVTKNSILLVDFANRERARGLDADTAMRHAGPVRLRPILMTALSMILAMIPVALGLSAGGEFRSSMAIAIMGGMITSTFLTLMVVPIGYSLVVGTLDRLGRRIRSGQERTEAGQSPAEGTVQPVGD